MSERLRESLEGLALNPDILVEIIQTRNLPKRDTQVNTLDMQIPYKIEIT
jgi:hypothetical protein